MGAARCERCGLELSPEARDGHRVGTIVGSYRIEGVRRSGAAGTWFQATEEVTGRLCELRVLSLTGASPALRERWRREAGRRLVHPALVRVVSAGEAGDLAWLATDARPDELALDAAVARDGAIPPLRAARLALDVARGLEQVHAQGLAHRALGPGSVLVSDDGRGEHARLADLGLAAALGPEPDVPAVTASGELIGDARYTAPEGPAGGAAADLYGLGATLSLAVGGRPPFDHALAGRSAARVEAAGAPPALLDLVRALTEPEPARRPPSARAAAERLAAILGLQPDVGSAAPSGPTSGSTPSSGHAPTRRRRRLVVAGYAEVPGPGSLDAATLDRLPLPVAVALADAWPPGPERRGQAFVLWERVTQLLAAIGVGALREEGRPLPGVLGRTPLRPSFGQWLEVAREAARALEGDDELSRALRWTLSEPFAGKKPLLDWLGEVVAARNRATHGHAEAELDLVTPALRLAAEGPLTRGALIVLESAEVVGPDLLRHAPLELRGQAPRRGRPFEGAPALARGRPYWRADGPARFVELLPFMAWHEGRLLVLGSADGKDRPELTDVLDGTTCRLPAMAAELSALRAEAGGAARSATEGSASGSAVGGPVVPASAGIPKEEGSDPLVGRVVGGVHRIAARIGAGGMGAVYRGWDTRLRREVAIKVLVRAAQPGDEARTRFEAEARTLASLSHPRIVRVHDTGRDGDLDWYVLELLPGPTLDAWVRSRVGLAGDEAARAAAVAALGAAGWRQVATWIRDAARAAHEAHGRGIVHRDLKPANLMLDAAGDVKVLDFGLAKHSDEDVTRSRAQLGTPRYMAPEQASDAKRVGPAADVYALGACLYALASLGKPFHEVVDSPTSAHVLLDRVRLGKLTRLRDRSPSVPEELATICHRALEVDPERRFPTAAALADDLDRWLEGRPILSRPAGAAERVVKWARREPAKAVALTVLLAATTGMSALGVVAEGQRREAEAQRAEAEAQRAEAMRQTQEATAQRRTAERATALALERAAEVERGAVAAAITSHESGLRLLWSLWDRERVIDPLRVVREAGALASDVARTLAAARTLPASSIPGGVSRLESVARSSQTAAETALGDELARGGRVVAGLFPPASAVLSPDGGRLLVSSETGQLGLWDVASGRPLATWPAHGAGVTDCAFAPDGRRLVSAGGDCTVRTWDAATGRCLLVVPTASIPLAVRLSPRGLLVGLQDGNLEVRGATGELQRRVVGGERAITCALSPDGRRAAFSGPKRVRLLDAETGRIQREARSGERDALSFSSDGRALLIASYRLRLWKVDDGNERTIEVEGAEASALAPDGTGVVWADRDGRLRVEPLAGGTPVELAHGGDRKAALSLAFGPDGRVVAALDDGSVRIWNGRTGEQLKRLQGGIGWLSRCTASPEGTVVYRAGGEVTVEREGGNVRLPDCTALASSPDGRRLLLASEGGVLRVCDVANGATLRVLTGHTASVWACAFAPDGRRAVSASVDRTLRVWDTETGLTLHVLEGHADQVRACAFGEGDRILSGSADGTLRVWSAATGRLVRALEGITVQACALDRTGRRALFTSVERELRVWEIETGVSRGLAQDVGPWWCAFGADDQSALSLSAEADSLREHDIETCRLLRSREVKTKGIPSDDGLHTGTRLGVRRWGPVQERRALPPVGGHSTFSRDGRGVVGLAEDGSVTERDLRTGQLLRRLEQREPLTRATLSPRGDLAVVRPRLEDSTFDLVELGTGQVRAALDICTDEVASFAFSADQHRLLIVSRAGMLDVRDLETRAIIALGVTVPRPQACAVGLDGRVLVCCDDGSLRLVAPDGQTLHIIEGRDPDRIVIDVDDPQTPTACAVSPDGRLLLSGSLGGALRVWDAESGALVRTIEGHRGSVASVGFSPDGRRLLSASREDGTIRVWDVQSGHLLRVIEEPCNRATFSPDGRLVLATGGVSPVVWDLGPALQLPSLDADLAIPLAAHLLALGRETPLTTDELPSLTPIAPPPPSHEVVSPEQLAALGLDHLLGRAAVPAAPVVPGATSGRNSLRAAAEQGHARAMTRLAWALERGLGGPVDAAARAEATALTTRAAALGDPLARGEVERAAASGDPLARTLQAVGRKDLAALRQLAAAHEPDAILALADLRPATEVLSLLERGAAIGDPACVRGLGERLLAVDPIRAVTVLQRAVTLGDVAAHAALAAEVARRGDGEGAAVHAAALSPLGAAEGAALLERGLGLLPLAEQPAARRALGPAPRLDPR